MLALNLLLLSMFIITVLFKKFNFFWVYIMSFFGGFIDNNMVFFLAIYFWHYIFGVIFREFYFWVYIYVVLFQEFYFWGFIYWL